MNHRTIDKTNLVKGQAYTSSKIKDQASYHSDKREKYQIKVQGLKV